MEERKSLRRRDFLGKAGALGLAGLGLIAGCGRKTAPGGPSEQASAPPAPAPTPEPTPQPPAPGQVRVAFVKHSGVQPAPGELDQAIVQQMLDEGTKQATGSETAEEAWSSLFASDDVVALKVNCISPTVFTHPMLAYAIAQRLLDVGVQPGNIIIWDRTGGELLRDGYDLQTASNAIQIRGVDGEWDPTPTREGSFEGRLAAILSQRCSALINVPVLKNHGASGVTAALKNHYGSHHNPNRHHGGQCDPFIADLNAIPAIRDKTRLIVCDVTRACANGGPGAGDPRYVWSPNGVLVATDPVAHDAVGTSIIDRKRETMGLGALQPKHLVTAGQRGLGTNDLALVDVLDIDLA